MSDLNGNYADLYNAAKYLDALKETGDKKGTEALKKVLDDAIKNMGADKKRIDINSDGKANFHDVFQFSTQGDLDGDGAVSQDEIKFLEEQKQILSQFVAKGVKEDENFKIEDIKEFRDFVDSLSDEEREANADFIKLYNDAANESIIDKLLNNGPAPQVQNLLPGEQSVQPEKPSGNQPVQAEGAAAAPDKQPPERPENNENTKKMSVEDAYKLSKDVTKADNTLKSAERNKNYAEKNYDKAVDRVDSIQNDISNLEAEISELKLKLNSAQSDEYKTAIERQIRTKENQLKAKNNSLKSAEKNLERAEERLSAAEEKYNEAESQAKILKDTLKNSGVSDEEIFDYQKKLAAQNALKAQQNATGGYVVKSGGYYARNGNVGMKSSSSVSSAIINGNGGSSGSSGSSGASGTQSTSSRGTVRDVYGTNVKGDEIKTGWAVDLGNGTERVHIIGGPDYIQTINSSSEDS